MENSCQEKETELGIILAKIADELNITDTMYDKAVQSYIAVGSGLGMDWILQSKLCHRFNESRNNCKPINENDDYDIDLVCLLHEGWQLDARTIKELVGKRLKENAMYKKA